MKDYPHIPRSTGQGFREIPGAYIFDKLDGSNMRSEWSRKRGWYKHGKRSGLIDDSNPHLVVVPQLFKEQLEEPLTRIARDNGWQNLVVFYEFWGSNSIAGLHYDDDPKFLTVFDAAADKKGIMGPKDFLMAFQEKVPTPGFLEIANWTRGYIEEVFRGEGPPGVTFEGVVAKAGTRHELIMAKAKTKAWIDKVLEVHGHTLGTKLINS